LGGYTVDHFTQNLSGHPLVVMALIFLALLILYFLFKQLVKMALLIVIIFFALAGYFYFKDPKTMPENLLKSLEKAKTQTGELVEKGKNAYQTGKDVVEKGKKWTEGADKYLGKKEPSGKE
jgi:hypothetical protein